MQQQQPWLTTCIEQEHECFHWWGVGYLSSGTPFLLPFLRQWRAPRTPFGLNFQLRSWYWIWPASAGSQPDLNFMGTHYEPFEATQLSMRKILKSNHEKVISWFFFFPTIPYTHSSITLRALVVCRQLPGGHSSGLMCILMHTLYCPAQGLSK